MKTLLISAALLISAVSAFGQLRGGEAPAHEQPSSGGSYQQPTQMESRTQNYQAPSQQYQQPAQQQPAQQSQKAVSSDKEGSSKAPVNEDKKTDAKNEEVTKQKKDTIHKGTEQKESLGTAWKCPKCGKIFVTAPAKGLCPDDGTPLVSVKAAK